MFFVIGGAEGPLRFIKGGPSGSKGPNSLCCLNGGPKKFKGALWNHDGDPKFILLCQPIKPGDQAFTCFSSKGG